MDMKRFCRTFAADDSGLVMFIVVAAMALVTVVAMAAFTLSQQSLADSVRVSQQTQAFQAANSGADVALALIQSNGFDTSMYPVTGTATDGSTYTADVVADTNAEYECVATGTDPSGKTETITVRFFYLNMWNMNLAAGAGDALGGGSVKGTTSVYGPFYVRGGVELGSSSNIEQGPFFIKDGDLSLTGNGQIGSAGAIDLYVTGQASGKTQNMNLNRLSHSVPDVQLPAVDDAYLQDMYGNAKAESIDNVEGDGANPPSNVEATNGDPLTYTTIVSRNKASATGSFYKAICADTGPAAAGTGTTGLTIGGTGSWGAASDDFAFDDSTNVLTVRGTVFIDGPLTLNDDILYQGNGAIVCNGNITINRSWRPNRAANNYYMAATHVVGLVTPKNITYTDGSNNAGKDPTAQPDLCGPFFASKDFAMNGNVLVKGSVIAGSITFNHANEHLVTEPDLPSFLPKGMPGSGTYILTKGAWTR